jgi:hypothetical protein
METVGHRLSLLMDDGESVRVFKQYLEADQLEPALDFWLACRGLRLHPNSTDLQTDRKLIRLIYKTYLRTTQADKPSPEASVLLKIVSPETKSHISERFHAERDQQSLDASVFDEAKAETESFLECKYSEFFQSDLYRQFVQQQKQQHQQQPEEMQTIQQILPSDQDDGSQLPLDSSQTIQELTFQNPQMEPHPTDSEVSNWSGNEPATYSEPESCPPAHIISGHRHPHPHRHRDRRLVQMDQLPEAGPIRAGSLVDEASHLTRFGLTVCTL